MKGGHWTERNFIDAVYEVGPADGHLEVCAECRGRWVEVQAVRLEITRDPEVPNGLLAQQRRQIHQRLDRSPRGISRVLTTFAVVLLLLMGVFFIQHWGRVPPTAPTAPLSDAQLFSEIYAVEQSSEPHIAKPMRSLFQEN